MTAAETDSAEARPTSVTIEAIPRAAISPPRHPLLNSSKLGIRNLLE
jgi:hypothetical protein